MLTSHLRNLVPGTIRSVICDDPLQILSDLELAALSHSEGFQFAVCRFEEIPVLAELLDHILDSLASIAKAIFPRWYSNAIDEKYPDPISLENRILNEFFIKRVAAEYPKVSAAWLRAATTCCMENKIPLSGKFTSEINALQLSLAISAEKLILILTVEDPNPRPQNLLGLSKAVEWFARVTGSAVCVLVSRSLSACKELEGVLYDSTELLIEAANRDFRRLAAETKYVFWPIQGYPHPFSPGEQALAKKLPLDPDLGGLFRFNETVVSTRNNRFVVDLLWPEGKVVVEVDGFSCHGNRYAFGQDRNRDYELVISGYLVLRLTHDEVLQDVAIALDKIRDVVNFRRNHPIINSEVPK